MIDFLSSNWVDAVTKGLGATHRNLVEGGSITCFKAGPFRIAYPDFFTGTQGPIGPGELAIRMQMARTLKADIVRLQTGDMQAAMQPLATHELGSCIISSLTTWDERNFDKARRTSNREKRSSLQLRKGRQSDGKCMHRLYLSTIRRHGGAARYNQTYFELIAEDAAIVAELDGQICGFVCVGFRNKAAYYMHGAHAIEARNHYVSDMLFLAMLRQAREAGMTTFDFLPSPADQPTLTSYKLLWGASTHRFATYDLALNPLRARCFLAAVKVANLISAQRRRG